jgi:hypothetical protein
MVCTCDFEARCGGWERLSCRAHLIGDCFCRCGCTEDCYGCGDCLNRGADDHDDYDEAFEDRAPASRSAAEGDIEGAGRAERAPSGPRSA